MPNQYRPPSEVAPPRVAALSVLPVFLDLKGKTALVFGGTAAAAWKAELLASAGARVAVHAPEDDVSEEMRALIARGHGAGPLHHLPCPWRVADADGAAIIVGDAETNEEAAEMRKLARAAGVPINVIDRPAFCDFQFGSIVNRSPVVVGISTSGAAPILGQAIRRRIETLLPPALALWAESACKWRDQVMARLTPGAQRRRFWEQFSDRAFGAHVDGRTAAEMEALLKDAETGVDGRTGGVTLVGAGPGDAELLTLKAVRALQAADIILFDDLVSEDVLELARREAKRMLVGKRGGRTSCRQDDINDLMVRLARSGKNVVRLKSGDPMIFGRGGEELERLAAENIACSVVPGVTAASAMASALGVSLTHRDFARSVHLVTGHSREGGLPADIDWTAVADPRTTTVFYMGGRLAGQIAARLLAEGLGADTPVAVAMSISREDERKWTGTLGELAADGLPFSPDGPVLIGVGGGFFAQAARDAGGAGGVTGRFGAESAQPIATIPTSSRACP